MRCLKPPPGNCLLPTVRILGSGNGGNALKVSGTTYVCVDNGVEDERGRTSVSIQGYLHFNAKTVNFEIKNGASVSVSGTTYVNSNTSCLSVSNSTLSVSLSHTKGTVVVAGKEPKITLNANYTFNNASATEYEDYPVLKFSLPETMADIWADALVQAASKMVTLGTNAVIAVELPEVLAKAGKRIRAPLITANTLTVLSPSDDEDGMQTLIDNARLPDGATLKVGSYNAETKKWEAVAGGKTLFVDIPSKNGLIIIVK